LADHRRELLIGLLAAIVTGLSGLAGAFIGGCATNRAARQAADAETKREERREAALTRGSARLLFGEYDAAHVIFSGALETDATPHYNPKEALIRLRLADELRLAAAMRPGEWGKMSDANTSTKEAVRVLSEWGTLGGREPYRPELPLDSIRREVFSLAVQSLRNGKRALRRLANVRVTRRGVVPYR
jgi:hypothetical protein